MTRSGFVASQRVRSPGSLAWRLSPVRRRRAGQRLRALTGVAAPDHRPAALLTARPRLALGIATTAVGGATLGVVGPVGALIVTVYVGLAVRLVQQREQRTRIASAESAAMDAVVALAADLRAGQSPQAALAAVAGALGDGGADSRHATGAGFRSRALGPGRQPGASPVAAPVGERVRAAILVSEAAGAPLADLLDRLDADVRARRQAVTQAAAQAAGATATSWLLTALPVAGVGLGYAMGVDPARQLLHTPLGAGCVVLALALQLGGLAWVSRIARGVTEVAR